MNKLIENRLIDIEDNLAIATGERVWGAERKE